MRTRVQRRSASFVGCVFALAIMAAACGDSEPQNETASGIDGSSSTTSSTTEPAPVAVPTSPDEVAAGHVAFIVGGTDATVLAVDTIEAPGETVVELSASNSVGDSLTVDADFLDGTISAQIGNDTWETSGITANSVGDTGWIVLEATATPTDDAATDPVTIQILGRDPGSTD